MRRIFYLVAGIVAVSAGAMGPAAAQLTVESYDFTARDGTTVAAEKGTFQVPENRNDPDSRMIDIGFVRFPATTDSPGAPIVYLAGGPGGSGTGTAEGPRFPLFMALREVADVIAFDQRGTGLSANDLPACDSGLSYPLDKPATRDASAAFYKEGAAVCAAFWKDAGIDLAGYNTLESAADLTALRDALGVEKINLWGISYGTHLALATLKAYPDLVERAVLASPEGLDQTVKLPVRTDAYFARVQETINRDPGAAAKYPDIAGQMRRVLSELEANPPTVEVTGADGNPVMLSFGKFEIQLLSGFSIADPRPGPGGLVGLLQMYQALDNGVYGPAAQVVHDYLRQGTLTFRPMSTAMDAASGISAKRAALVAEQAETALLGDALNFPVPHISAADLGIPDLGDDFRAPLETDVPALIFSGTLDGRTYPEAAREVAAQFADPVFVTVENAGHNLFMVNDEVQARVKAFLAGEVVSDAAIRIDPPQFE